ALRRNHHVRRLNVTVNDTPPVSITESGQYLVYVVKRLSRRERPLFQSLRQRHALHVLHDHDQLVVDGQSCPKIAGSLIVRTGRLISSLSPTCTPALLPTFRTSVLPLTSATRPDTSILCVGIFAEAPSSCVARESTAW